VTRRTSTGQTGKYPKGHDGPKQARIHGWMDGVGFCAPVLRGVMPETEKNIVSNKITTCSNSSRCIDTSQTPRNRQPHKERTVNIVRTVTKRYKVEFHRPKKGIWGCWVVDVNVLYHSLSRPKEDRKKSADAIEFSDVGDGVLAIFTE
jgi:hypothetical protein